MIFTSSEMVFDYQRKTIEEAFSGTLYDWYGEVERVGAIGQCPQGSYHIIEDYSVMECIPQNDNFHEIIGTSLNNFIMPLIRYKTFDLIELDDKNCSCKCSFRSVKRIAGRTDSYLKTSDGRCIGSAALSLIPRGVSHLKESQFVQWGDSKIIINVVCTDNFSKEDEALLLKNAKSFISKDMDISINRVNTIPRTKSGKFSLIESRNHDS